ncbi:class I SAM-dependent methyltransferase [Actinoplanes sp. NPDC051494]|uniref:class I SAM-dependent methyltransferase n=1 Tax=Actinoplanes sp. NPDC051494 TaxID=3363907 RepID=UPI003788D2CC
MAHDHGHDHGHHSHGHHDHAEDTYAEMLDLDAEVLHEYHAGLQDLLHQLSGDPRRILDVGSGTGTGTLALARSFPAAEILALDVSEDLLTRLVANVRAQGIGDRVHPVRADLDAGWPTLEPVDLAWASASMHHLADPGRVVADVLATLRPGGLFAIVEMSGFPRFLPDDLGFGRPGLEARMQALVAEQRAHDMPHMGDDWGIRLTRAGFTVEAERHVPIELTAPPRPATGRYAQAALRRLRGGLADRLDPADLATLDDLTTAGGPRAILDRDDLTVRTDRSVWIGRRPVA